MALSSINTTEYVAPGINIDVYRGGMSKIKSLGISEARPKLTQLADKSGPHYTCNHTVATAEGLERAKQALER